MALASTIADRQAKRSTTSNRRRQHLAEVRLSEIVKVAGIADEYQQIDRAGDLQMESWFALAYQSMPTDELRGLIARGFVTWQRTEQAEETHVRGDVDASVDLLKGNNNVWLGESAR